MDTQPVKRLDPSIGATTAPSRLHAALSANPIVIDTAIAVFLAALSLIAYVGAAPYTGPLSWVTLAFLLL
jgi:hypothetical protein